MTNTLFDLSEQYDEMLERGIRLSGENKFYFVRRRVLQMRLRLGADFRPRRILDFGCGIGDSTRFLAEIFPSADILGVDTAAKALEYAARENRSSRISFQPFGHLSESGTVDLCYTSGVFHHVEPAKRVEILKRIHTALAPEGCLAFFENNPWNPGTRLVMKRIPFDKDAKPLSFPQAKRLLQAAGFSPRAPHFLFYFPRPLAFLRFLEPALAGLPLGAQYFILAAKGDSVGRLP